MPITPDGIDGTIAKLSEGITRMNNVLDLMLDVFEKGARSDTPSSLYFSNQHNMPKELANFDMGSIKEFSQLTEKEIDKLKARVASSFKKTYEKLSADINRYEKAAANASDESTKRFFNDLKTRKEAEKRAMEAPDGALKQFDELKNLTELFVNESDDAAKARIAAMIEEKETAMGLSNMLQEEQAKIKTEAEATLAAIGMTLDDIKKWKEQADKYESKRIDLQNASLAISRSGLGNTSFGRAAQNAISRQQNINALGNFGNNLNNGNQATSIASSLFGTGKAANGATKFLKGFGGMLGKVAAKLGPWGTLISVLIDAFKAAAKAVNDWKQLTAEFVKYQTEIEKINYEEAKQKKTLETEIEVEKITYMGDMALKMLETQSANLLEATDIQMNAYAKSFEVGVGAMTKGINATAYDAAEAAIDQAASLRKLQVHTGQREKQYELYGQKRSLEAESKIAESIVGMGVAQAEAAASRKEAATEMYNKELQYTANAANAATSLDIVGTGANIAMATRDERNNTTTGEYGKGNVNPMTGEKNEIGNYKDYGVDKITGVTSGASAQAQAAAIGAGNNGDIGGILAEISAYTANHTQRMRQTVDAIKTDTELHYKKALAETQVQTSLTEKMVDTQTQYAEKVIDTATRIEKNWLGVVKHVESWTEKFDEKFTDLSFNLGFLNKQNQTAYKNAQFDIIKSVARSFGKSEEDVARIQSGYTDNTGRTRLMGKMDMRQMTALGTYLGDDGLAAQFASEMDIFNAGASQSVDLLNKTLQSVNKIGLNGRKYTKEVVNNLKLAQKYNFKEGTKGFMEMAKWAQKTRFNMASLGGMLDKIIDGGIEETLKTSAGFQVLGGQAAMNSDPFGMLYDALADPASYAKRMQNMTKGFGTVDRETGETKFNSNELLMMNQFAKLQGRSREEVMNEARERNKREVVNNSINASTRSRFNQDQLDYLGSVAEFDREDKRFKVKVFNKEKGEYEAKDINSVTEEDLKNVMPTEHNEKMETWMEQLVSTVTQMKGEQIWQTVDAASATYAETLEHFSERLNKMHDSYINEREKILENIKTKQDEVDKSVESYLSQFANNVNETNSAVAAETEKIRNATNDIAGALDKVAKVVKEAENKMRIELNGSSSSSSTTAKANGTVSSNPASKNSSTTNANSQSTNKPKQAGHKGDTVVGSYSAVTPANSWAESLAMMKDGIVSGNGKPMIIGADSVVPINDGVLTRGDDSAVVKAPNRGVDKWMNGLGSKITNMHEDVVNGVLPDAMKLMHDAWNNPSAYAKRLQNLYETNGGVQPGGKRDVNVNINGKLMLDGGGQQIDLFQLLKENPDLVRKITEAVINQMSSNANGGKYEMFSNRYYR